MKPQMKWLKNEKGLTLIELLAVIVVLGIIAAIAVPAIQGTIEKQRINADEKSSEIIEAASLRYFYDSFPDGELDDGTKLGNGDTHTVDVVNATTDPNLKDLGYLSDDFNHKLQSEDKYFVTVTATYSTTNGWHDVTVNTSATNPIPPATP